MEAPLQSMPMHRDEGNTRNEYDCDGWVIVERNRGQGQSWDTLPPELILHIFSFLKPKDLCNVTSLNSQCAMLAADNALRWPPSVLPKQVTMTWKSIYQDLASEERGVSMRLVIDNTKFLCNVEGQEVTGTVYVKLPDDTQIRGLFISFEARETSTHSKENNHREYRSNNYFHNYKTIAGRFAYKDYAREYLVLPAGWHQFSFSMPVPAASDKGLPMERSVAYKDRNVRYILTARLVRVGVFNFDITRSQVMEFRRLPTSDDVLLASEPAVAHFRSGYLFGQQMHIQVMPYRTHWRCGETMSVALEVINPSKWSVMSAEMDLYLESNTAGWKPQMIARTQRHTFAFQVPSYGSEPKRVTLTMPIPKDIDPTVNCHHFTLQWNVEILIRVEYQLTPFYIRVPIEILEEPFSS